MSEHESGPAAPAPPAANPHAPAGDSAARRETAAQIRRDRPGWVVIWSARRGEYQARPLFRAPRDTVAAAASHPELIARMDHVEQARPARAARRAAQAQRS